MTCCCCTLPVPPRPADFILHGLRHHTPVRPASSATSMLSLRAAVMGLPRSVGAAAKPVLSGRGLSAALGGTGVSGSCNCVSDSSSKASTHRELQIR